jgi:hypothetical protein
MSTRIKCGHCKGYHGSIVEVRTCSNAHGRIATAPLPGTLAAQGCIKGEVCNCPPSYSTCYRSNVTPLVERITETPPNHPSRRTHVVDMTPINVPSGRYAVELAGVLGFYKVDAPKSGRWAGYTFVKQYASDDEHAIRSTDRRERILRQITEDGVDKAMLRYGREIGRCGHCNRTLTDEVSRARGIGPVCASKMGY